MWDPQPETVAVCGKNPSLCHSEEPQATRNLALPRKRSERDSSLRSE